MQTTLTKLRSLEEDLHMWCNIVMRVCSNQEALSAHHPMCAIGCSSRWEAMMPEVVGLDQGQSECQGRERERPNAKIIA
jgi:hypothetical protein